jgi:uncharacterized protein (UPF0332 family)
MKSGNLGRVPIDPAFIAAELREAENDLDVAGKSFKDGNDKWAVRQGYYALQEGFRALALMKGYEARTDDCLKSAIQELYMKEQALDPTLLENFDYGKEIAEGEDCLCVYDRDTIEEVLAQARVLIEKATEMAKRV